MKILAALSNSIKSSAYLTLGYLMGQGLVFFAQLNLKLSGKQEELGLVVMLISLFSLAVQFGEFGGSTYVIKKIKETNNNLVPFYVFRVLAALGVMILVVLFGSNEINKILDPSFTYIFVLIAVISALNCMPCIEYDNKYKLIAILSAVPWVLVAVSVYIVDYTVNYGVKILVYGALVGVVFVVANTWFFAARGGIIFGVTSIKQGLLAGVSYIVPPLCGQMVGRFVLLYVGGVSGLQELGDYGLYKYLQVGAALLLGFLIRPLHRQFIIDYINKPCEKRFFAVLMEYYATPLFFSVVISIAVCVLGYFYINTTPWYLMVASMPFWVAAGVATQFSSKKMSGTLFMKNQYIGFVVNIAAFILISEYNIVLAIAAGEIAQYCYLVIVSFFYQEKY